MKYASLSIQIVPILTLLFGLEQEIALKSWHFLQKLNYFKLLKTVSNYYQGSFFTVEQKSDKALENAVSLWAKERSDCQSRALPIWCGLIDSN